MSPVILYPSGRALPARISARVSESLVQTVESLKELSEKFALGRALGKSDIPKGRSPEDKSIESLFKRLEHGKDLYNECEKSPLWKHCSIQHGGMVRLQEADICMNSENEFHQPEIVRVMAVRGQFNEEQAVIFPCDGKRGGTRGRGRVKDTHRYLVNNVFFANL